MKYLVGIALGPVQTFISAARKTRDLYAGSAMLSELSKAAGRFLLENGADLIFPHGDLATLAPGSEFRAVNKLLAIVETEVPLDISAAVKDKARERLRELSTFGNIHPVQFDQKRFDQHLKSFPEIYCAWTPYREQDYEACRQEVEELLAARKLLNDFSQHTGPSGMRKNSLDGARETVITHRGNRPTDLIRLRAGEELDALGLVKRFGRIKPRFDSTIELAGLPYLKRVQTLAHPILQRLTAAAGLSEATAELLYDHESRELFPDNPVKLRELQDIRQEIYAACGRPDAPYYALLAADGDSMGSRLSSLGLAQHKTLSRQLSEFASRVKAELDALECMPIFTGGDDVRAAIPLHRLQEALASVNRTFRETVVSPNKEITMSAGVAIMHALDPLDDALRTAKEAEKEAKRVDGKNALSVVVCPRSGASVTATDKWDNMLPLLSSIDAKFQADALSYGFAHELRDLLGHTPSELDDVLPDLAMAIAKRKKKAEQDAALELVRQACNGDVHYREGLAHLMNCMLVTRKLSRAARTARAEAAQ